MNMRTALRIIFVVSLAGIGFSGTLTYQELWVLEGKILEHSLSPEGDREMPDLERAGGQPSRRCFRIARMTTPAAAMPPVMSPVFTVLRVSFATLFALARTALRPWATRIRVSSFS